MKLVYDCKYKERLCIVLTEFFNFYSQMYQFSRVVENQVNDYLCATGPSSTFDARDAFDVKVLQNYFKNNQGASREFLVSMGINQKLLFSLKVWTTITARRTVSPMFQAALEIDGYRVEIDCNDDMAFKLVSTILTKLAFVNGPAYHDNLVVDGETFKMAYYIAACFYKLGGDSLGYLSTLDEARDKA